MTETRQLAENKLILLYIIDRIDLPVSNHHITRIVLENNYMNYFMLQQYLNELCSDNLLKCEKQDEKTLYSITKDGRQILSYFTNLVPSRVKTTINSIALSLRKNIKNETHITADYLPGNCNDFIAVCKVMEDNFTLIELSIAVGTQKDAQTICENWKKYSYLIYPELIESLMKKRN